MDSAHVAIVALQGTLCGTHHSLAHLDLAWRHHVEATEEAEEMLQARLQEGRRLPPGKILHILFHDECVVCKCATKGTSWRWRSPWQPWQQRRPRSPWQPWQHHGRTEENAGWQEERPAAFCRPQRHVRIYTVIIVVQHWDILRRHCGRQHWGTGTGVGRFSDRPAARTELR